jgi:hypothetical protein
MKGFNLQMKHLIYLVFFSSLFSTALNAQIAIPLERNQELSALHAQQLSNLPKGWEDQHPRERDCNLEIDQPGFIYIEAGESISYVIEIDTTGLDTLPGTYNCLNCSTNSIWDASLVNDTFYLTASEDLIYATNVYNFEYCTDNGCNNAHLSIVGRRKGQNYFPNPIFLDPEEAVEVTAQASLLPRYLACNKIIDAEDDYQGRSQLVYFTNYSNVDSTIVYKASRYAGIDSINVVLCDSVPICDTFHYAFHIQHDTLKLGSGGLQYFMDDFSYSGPFTDAALWLDADTYVNRTYANDAPSIGVATFDGIQITGKPWGGGYGPADQLTSTYLDLTDVSGSIYLSFWLRAQGLGLPPDPEEEDIFIIEFLDSEGVWQLIDTYTPTDTNEEGLSISSSFLFYHYEITSDYLHDAFQFRFTAYNDRRGVGDIWNLDYVRINSEADQPFENDVAFTVPPAGILNLYRSMPWRHFRGQVEALSRPTLDVGLFNFDNNTTNVGDAELRLVEEVTSTIVYEGIEILNEQSPNLVSGATFLTPDIASFSTQLNTLQSGIFDDEERLQFRMSYRLIGPQIQNTALGQGRDGILVNDTTSLTTVFDNYFAYDDGSAEYAVLAPEMDQIAVKFTASVADTLRAVQFHFPRLLSDASLQDFNLRIWIDTLDDEPDYSINLLNPIFPDTYYDTLQGFTTYLLTNTEGGLIPIEIPAGDFYIGWQQQSNCDFNDCIAVGMDRNNPDALSTLFFKNNSEPWIPFPDNFTPGALLLRAVVGSETPPASSGVGQLEQAYEALQVFPNPSDGWFNLQLNNTKPDDYELFVHNALGQLHYQGAFQTPLDLSYLQSGLYLITAINRADGTRLQQKIVLKK